MKEGARNILETALTNAVAGPMNELQRKNQRATGALLVLSAAWISTSFMFVDARERSAQLFQTLNILEQGYRVPAASPVESFLMLWKLEDGTVMTLNLPRPPEASV
jgi:hypothetical protein